MARALRITFPDAFDHVTSRGNERKAVFKSKLDREKFIEGLESAYILTRSERKYLRHRSNMTGQAINFINVKMYFCQRYTGKKLKEIGLHFGIGESGVSPACRRVAQKIEKDKKPKKNYYIRKINKSVKNEDLTPMSSTPMSSGVDWWTVGLKA